jgi:hypothetical protein
MTETQITYIAIAAVVVFFALWLSAIIALSSALDDETNDLLP